MAQPEREGRAPVKFTVVVPCYNEQETLAACVERVLQLQEEGLELELIVVDDCSRDGSLAVARALAARHPEVRVLRHEVNRGKGAALRTGFRQATGDFVAIQDADLEYDPRELKTLLEPLVQGDADVVFGSRFLGGRPHRVLYFWHSMGNGFLTLLSNMFTDLNLTDMETCYKVFRREVIQGIDIQEDRFGFEPEIVAKVAHQGLRVYEMGISYHGRTYEEGKKIGVRDGFRALYCIFRYNAHRAPVPIQFAIYTLIGGASAVANVAAFLALLALGAGIDAATITSFVGAAALNYFLCVGVLFRRRARWNSAAEVAVYSLVALASGGLDLGATRVLAAVGTAPWLAKSLACAAGLAFNFVARRFCVFPEKRRKVARAPLEVVPSTGPRAGPARGAEPAPDAAAVRAAGVP